MPTPKELNAFHQLQKLFASPSILHHFNEWRQLFIDLDASKEWGLGAVIYHIVDDEGQQGPSSTQAGTTDFPKQKSQQPILFLSRLLTEAETRYWPTELEIAGLVWVVKKVRYMIEATRKPTTIIYTDHSAAVSIVRQTSLNTVSTEKLNLRLVRASEYLQRFRLDVRYKPGKANVVPDALSRLASRDCRPNQDSEGELDALAVKCFPVSLVEMSQSFRERLIAGYQEEPRWSRVMDMVKQNKDLGENAAKLAYEVVGQVLYFRDDEQGLRLCIPTSAIEAEVFKLAHDEMGHPGYARTHEKLTEGVYIHNMSKKLHEFIRHCPNCQLNQTPRHQPYGSLQPILTPARPFHTITIDFILALPLTAEGYDCIMSATCTLSKAVTLIPGKSTWAAKDWAIRLLDKLADINWGLPRAIISDRDRKFVGELWQQIFHSLNVDLLYSTAWHHQTDGQSERSNQTAEIALRYYIATIEHESQWPSILPRVTAALNNSTKYSSTNKTPTEVLYGFKTREALDLLKPHDETDDVQANITTRTSLHRPIPATPMPATSTPAPPAVTSLLGRAPVAMTEYRPSHIDAKDAIAFASLRMKDYYDSKHMAKFFNVGDLVNIRLHRGYRVPSITSKKLGQQLVGPFKVLERIGRLAYRLQLPHVMQIHDVISIAHLEPATDPAEDPYRRRRLRAPPVVVDGETEYEIERLLQKRRIRKGRGWSTQYLVRWLGYGPEDDVWMPDHRLPNAEDLVRRYEGANGLAVGVDGSD